jgi:rRNA biogenesis protein RRP5
LSQQQTGDISDVSRQFTPIAQLSEIHSGSSHFPDSTMAAQKRKEGPNGSTSAKSAKPAADARPSKRAKADDAGKDADKKKAKGATQQAASPAKPPAAPIVTKEEAPLFPRGGGSILTPLEQKQISIQAKQDVLFEEQSASKKKKDVSSKRKRRKSQVEESDKKAVKDEDAVKVESLNFKARRTPSCVQCARI